MDVREFLEDAWLYEKAWRCQSERAEQLWFRCQRISARPLNVVGGSGGHDQNDLLAEYADAKTQEVEAFKRSQAHRERVEALLEHMENPMHRIVLSSRYLYFDSCKQIAKKLHRSERTVYRLHQKALDQARELWENCGESP